MTMVLGNPDAYKKPLEDLYGRSIDLDLTSEKLDAKTVLMKYAAYRKMGEKERELTGGGLEMAGKDMMAEKMEGAAPADSMMEGKSLSFGGMTLRRAAELEQPARGGHFLTEFGQSQRMLIDGGSKAGSVPQVLMMMNGNGQQMLTSPSSLLFRTMEKATEPAGKVESVFLSVLGRRPTAPEQEIAKRNIDAAGPDAYSNLIWALINTREFIFVQ